jgi:hypothetical protein
MEEMRNQGFGVIHPAIESGKLAPAVEAEVQKKMEAFVATVCRVVSFKEVVS